MTFFLPSDTKSVEQYKQLVNQQHVSPMLSINVWFIVCPIIFVIFTNTPSNNDIAAPQLDWIIHNSIIKDGATDNCNSLSLLTNKYHLSKLTTQWNLHTLHHLHNNNTPLIYSIISQYCITFEGITPVCLCGAMPSSSAEREQKLSLGRTAGEDRRVQNTL